MLGSTGRPRSLTADSAHNNTTQNSTHSTQTHRHTHTQNRHRHRHTQNTHRQHSPPLILQQACPPESSERSSKQRPFPVLRTGLPLRAVLVAAKPGGPRPAVRDRPAGRHGELHDQGALQCYIWDIAGLKPNIPQYCIPRVIIRDSNSTYHPINSLC